MAYVEPEPAQSDQLSENADRSGLSRQEALRRMEEYGPNELPVSAPRSIFRIVLDVFREPMVFLLLAGGAIYLALGDRQEAASLLGFLVLIIGITIRQEQKTEWALEALRDLSSPRALVVRDGARVRIPGREVVPGDLLILSEGNRVAADGILASADNLATDESLLTGESLPVEKRASRAGGIHQPEGALPDPCRVYAGSSVVRGYGLASVTSTGARTELGKIGKSLQGVSQDKSRLQLETRKLVRVLALFAGALCVLVALAFALTRRDLLGGVLVGISLAMAILPNELPAVLLIFLSTGAWRLSQRRVLTRRVPAVETLGSATVLCVDKTGTLTLNRMAIQAAWVSGSYCDLSKLDGQPLPDEFHEVFEFGVLASRPEAFDPMERAFHSAGTQYLAGTEHLHRDWALLKEYPITDSLLAVSYAWRPGRDSGYTVAAKGAPEAIVDLCHLPSEPAERVKGAVRRLASEGFRVLGVAKAHTEAALPSKQHDLDFGFIGLIGLADPIRPDVPRAIRDCSDAGIRVVMITGDHPDTARSIGRKIGLAGSEEVITGPEIVALDEDALKRRLRHVGICSRTLPEQKLRIVTALKQMGEVVAMTGDGVNDAPALKSADIGIAMGRRGTDVAREAASLVLLDDDFSSITSAIRMGRRIFANLRHALSYLLAVHVPITALSVLPVFFKLPLILLPIHIAFLHLIIEPACTFVFEAEPESATVMKRPPRSPKEPLFPPRILSDSIVRGAWVTLVILGVYLIALWRGQGEEDARALTFTSLIIANLGLIAVNRTRSPAVGLPLRAADKTLPVVILSSLLLLGVVLYVPFFRQLFRFSVLHPVDLLICLGVGAVSMAWSASSRKGYPD